MEFCFPGRNSVVHSYFFSSLENMVGDRVGDCPTIPLDSLFRCKVLDYTLSP